MRQTIKIYIEIAAILCIAAALKYPGNLAAEDSGESEEESAEMWVNQNESHVQESKIVESSERC